MIRLDRFDKKSVNYSTNRTVSGYKDSILGIIPDDWEVRKLKEVSKRVQRRNDCKPYEVLTISSIGGFLNQTERFSKVIAGKNIAKYILLKKNEFAYNKGNSKTYPFGCIFRLEDYEKALVPNVYYCFEIVNGISEFYKHYFIAGKLNRQLSRVINTGVRNDGLLNLNVGDFFDAYVPAPPLEEQKKIATILSNWDKAIELKEKLIEQKKEQKKGLMQKLLTGEVRLPGFECEWEEVKLGELGELKTSSVNKKINEEEEEVFLVNYMDVYKNNVIDENIYFMKVTAPDKQIKTSNVRYGDVLFTPSSETPDDIGHSAVVKINSKKTLFSYHLVRLRFSREMDVDFKAYVFNSSELMQEFSKRATGVTRYTLTLSDFEDSTIKIPRDINEQRAIGRVLSKSDKEIKLLEQEVHELKIQKKGLMQLLLTGKIRVKV